MSASEDPSHNVGGGDVIRIWKFLKEEKNHDHQNEMSSDNS